MESDREKAGVRQESNGMAEKPVWLLLIKMCSQATFSLFVYSAYSFTDTWAVAKWAGVMASAGVGILSPVFFILGGISSTLGTGGASMLSRALGRREGELAAKIVGNTMVLFFGFALAFSVFGEMSLDRILLLWGAEGELYESALAYGRILIAGAVTSTGFSSLMRAAGHLKYATFQWIVPIFVNLCFDILFVYGMKMGVRGAAWATVLSQIASTITCLYYFFRYRKKTYRITVRSVFPDRAVIREILAVGSPSLLREMGNSMVVAAFQAMVISAGSAVVYAAYVIVNQILQIFWTPHTGIAQGIQPLIGFFGGSGDYGKQRNALRGAVWTSILYGVGSIVVCKLVFESAFLLFSDNPTLLGSGKEIFAILIFMFPAKGVGGILLAVLQAEGRAKCAWILSILITFGIPFPCLFLCGAVWGITGLWVSMVASEWIGILCAALLCRGNPVNCENP